MPRQELTVYTGKVERQIFGSERPRSEFDGNAGEFDFYDAGEWLRLRLEGNPGTGAAKE
jgi:hypothetical protein